MILLQKLYFIHIMSLLISLIIGGIAGLLAGTIRRGHGFGFFGNIIVGIVGGFVGGFLASFVGITDTNWLGQILISTIGAVVLLAILNFFGNKTV
jgi:uncharacterized membrane protein YeaQ/YmgE (transglycosylase-associated protein family)